MTNPTIVILFFLARLVIPFIAILLVGEWYRRHESSSC